MNPIHRIPLPARLEASFVCACLLERMEQGPGRFDAAQYRLVARRLAQELARVPRDRALLVLLDAMPVAAQVFETIEYEMRGLCRAPRELSRHTETQAAEAIMLAQYRARAWR